MNKFLLFAFILFISGCASEETLQEEIGEIGKIGEDVMRLSSPAFVNNGMIPPEYTCDGDNINPALDIGDIPKGTKTLALIMDDPDAPAGVWVHWVVWNITPTNKIEKDSTPGVEGTNDFRKTSYGGPCPPSGTHRYFFKLYALDTELGIKPGASKKELEKAMQGHILANAELVGKYGRQ